MGPNFSIALSKSPLETLQAAMSSSVGASPLAISLRTAPMTASLQMAEMSAPVQPSVFSARVLRSTSSSMGLPLVWISKIFTLESASGGAM